MGWAFEALRWVDLLGVFANALLGGVIARRERFDIIGFGVLAILSGLGGGLLRDVLLPVTTPAALADPTYLITAIAGATVSYVLHIRGRLWEYLFPVFDALALGAWAAAGTTKALSYGLHWLPAIMLGTITAVGGGAVRDIVLRRVPGVLGGNTLYATCAIAASAVAVVGVNVANVGISLLGATVVGAGLCLAARWRGWVLPEADAWSVTMAIPQTYRKRIREQIVRRRSAGHRAHRGPES